MKYLILKHIIFMMCMVFVGTTSFTQDFLPEWQRRSTDELQSLAEKYKQILSRKKTMAIEMAREKGWPVREVFPDGTIIELMWLRENGMPVYYTTENANAARTTGTDKLLPGGATGMNLTGDGFTLAIWDGGGIRLEHDEFRVGAGASRVIWKDTADLHPYSQHSTHVAGTLVAEGDDPDAKGMAPSATLHAYTSTADLGEVFDANAIDNIFLSNHSYGELTGWYFRASIGTYYWLADTTVNEQEDYKFGYYDPLTKSWDSLAYVMQDYLFVRAAGNDRNDTINGTLWHLYWNKDSLKYKWSNKVRDHDGGVDRYECLNPPKTAKNLLIVGAVNDIPAGYNNPNDVVITDFSNWGPTDDGRIKPDIVGNGLSLYSCDTLNDTDYDFMDGTSMATANVCGTLALLQDYYDESRPFTWIPQFMTSAQLKALAIHTAHEAGTNPGPDYQFGWGLLNAVGAAELVQEDSARIRDFQPNYIRSYSLSNGDTLKNVYYCDGTEDIDVTLCWVDPPGTPVYPPVLNPINIMLVNDLDVRLIEMPAGSETLPWTLDHNNPDVAAARGDNFRDNVERIDRDNPPAGYYNVFVHHKGALASAQDFALIVTGMEGSVPGIWTGGVSTNWNNKFNWSLAEVPDTTVDVTVPAGCPNYPVLNGNLRIKRTEDAAYYCGSLAIYNGATVTVNGHDVINDSLLFVEGSLIIGKDLIMNETSSTEIAASGMIYTGQADGVHGGTWMKDWASYIQSSGELHTESLKIDPDAMASISGGLIELYKFGYADLWQDIEIDCGSFAFYNLTIGVDAEVRLNNCDVAVVNVSNQFSLKGYFNNNQQNFNSEYLIVYSSGYFSHRGGVVNLTGTGD